MNKPETLVIIICLTTLSLCTLETVKAHFEEYDLNKDGLLERDEYIRTLKVEDQDYEMDDDD